MNASSILFLEYFTLIKEIAGPFYIPWSLVTYYNFSPCLIFYTNQLTYPSKYLFLFLAKNTILCSWAVICEDSIFNLLSFFICSELDFRCLASVEVFWDSHALLDCIGAKHVFFSRSHHTLWQIHLNVFWRILTDTWGGNLFYVFLHMEINVPVKFSPNSWHPIP